MTDKIYKLGNITKAKNELLKSDFFEHMDHWRFNSAAKVAEEMGKEKVEGSYNFQVGSILLTTIINPGRTHGNTLLFEIRNKLLKEAGLIKAPEDRFILVWNVIIIESMMKRAPDAFLLSDKEDREKTMQRIVSFFETTSRRFNFSNQFYEKFDYLNNESIKQKFSVDRIIKKDNLY